VALLLSVPNRGPHFVSPSKAPGNLMRNARRAALSLRSPRPSRFAPMARRSAGSDRCASPASHKIGCETPKGASWPAKCVVAHRCPATASEVWFVHTGVCTRSVVYIKSRF
jgi:hypothetical protein